MNSLSCEQCSAPLALADTLCLACGAPAPKGRAAQVLLDKAEALYGQGSLPEAVRTLERALQASPEPEALNWRKLGVWQEKLGQFSSAGSAFRKALGLDDADEMAHQLFIANLGRQGRGPEALAFYKARLEGNPSDAVAAKQIGIIKLSADFLSKPPPAAAAHELTRVERWLKPTPLKVSLLLANAAVCLGVMAKLLLSVPPETGDAAGLSGAVASNPADLAASLTGMFNDPYIWAFQAALSFTCLGIMFWSRK